MPKSTINARATLASLRWEEDQLIRNHEGEWVWLGPCYDSDGKRIGITDCCPADNPCERHKIES